MVGGIESSRATNKLTDRTIKAFIRATIAGTARTKKLSDGGGLHMIVTRAGTASWRLKYRHGGKEKLMGLGAYPGVSLEAAREARDDAKALLREGRDPVDARRLDRAQAAVASDRTFASVASDWLAMNEPRWTEVHMATSRRALERDVFPALGRLPVSEITSAMVSDVIKRILGRGVRDTAGKVLSHIEAIYRFARAMGLCSDNPARDVREILPPAHQVAHRRAILVFDGLRDILRRIAVAPLTPSVRTASRLGAFTYTRPSNVVSAEWPEFNLDCEWPTWTIPRAKMKVKKRGHDHVVYLGPTIASELREWRELTGATGFLFPSPAGKRPHITVEGLDRAYSRTLNLSGVHSPHGWRAAFKTLAIEEGGFSRDATELALDHVHDTEVVRAYDRGARLDERRRMTMWWDESLVRVEVHAGHLRLHRTDAA